MSPSIPSIMLFATVSVVVAVKYSYTSAFCFSFPVIEVTNSYRLDFDTNLAIVFLLNAGPTVLIIPTSINTKAYAISANPQPGAPLFGFS